MLLALLGGCGGGSGDGDAGESMAAFTQQKLDWRACDETFLGPEQWEKQKGIFEPLGPRARCALMRAPLDYADPASGEVQVALSRVTAEQPQQRMGALFFNPGGPGVDGLALSATFAQQWSLVDQANPASAQFKQMSERYDLIGFSPRGLGAGTKMDCGAPVGPSVDSYSMHDTSLENQLGIQSALLAQAQACSNNPLGKHLHTIGMARDMDLMRALLGEEKIHYIGYSYGTTLGAWYASLFPERVGRMLLDSSTDVLGNVDEMAVLHQLGMERLKDEIFLPYATRHPLVFNLGESVEVLRKALNALSPRLKDLLFSTRNYADGRQAIDWNGVHPQSIDHNLVHMNAALGLQALVQQQPAANGEQIQAAIANHRFAPHDGVNQAAVVYAQQLAARLFEAPDRSAKKVPVEEAVRWSVLCNDKGATFDIPHPSGAPTDEALADEYCDYWPKSRLQRPRFAMAQKAGPILMLQSRYDALTPMEGAQATLDALPNASMIVVENDFKHGVFPYGEQCVDTQVINYFLYGTMPPRQSSCAGRPRRFDAEPAAGNGDGDF